MINSITSSAYSCLPEMRLASPQQMLQNVKKIALPLISLYGAFYLLQPVEGGPLTYAACMATCLAATSGAFPPACHAACLTLLGMPSP